MSKVLCVNVIIFMVIIGVCLGYLYAQPIEIAFTEADNQPGYTAGDQLINATKTFQIEAYTKYPNYVIGLALAIGLSVIGFIISMIQLERIRRAEREADIHGGPDSAGSRDSDCVPGTGS